MSTNAIHRLDPITRRRLLDHQCRWYTAATNVRVVYSTMRNAEFERTVTGELLGVADMVSGTTNEALIIRATNGNVVGLPVATVVRITVGEMPYPTVDKLLEQAGLA